MIPALKRLGGQVRSDSTLSFLQIEFIEVIEAGAIAPRSHHVSGSGKIKTQVLSNFFWRGG